MPAQLTDPRTRRSRSALESALRELIAERELGQISVSDLTKRAGVDRSTFYEHYSDVGDLAAAACTGVFDELIEAIRQPGRPRTPEDAPRVRLARLYAHVAEHAPLYRALLGDHGNARVINHLLGRLIAAAHVGRARAAGAGGGDGRGENPHDPLAAFVAGAVLGSIVDWVGRGCPGTPEEMSAAVWPHLIASVRPGPEAGGEWDEAGEG
jgi:AcrR family transcriptional regulator